MDIVCALGAIIMFCGYIIFDPMQVSSETTLLCTWGSNQRYMICMLYRPIEAANSYIHSGFIYILF